MANVLYPNFKIQIQSAEMEPNIQIANPAMKEEGIEWKSHAAEPIKSRADIQMVSNYLVENERYRDNLMFLCGINFGLRCSDLVQLKYGHILNTDGSFKDTIWIREIKTQKRRGANAVIETENGIQYKLKNPRPVFVTDSIKQAMCLYCNGRAINRDDYLFPGRRPGTAMSYEGVYDLFTKLLDRNRKTKKPGVLADRLSKPVHASTHMLRKTFAYHFIMSAPERNRAVEYLQTCFQHSNQLITLHYAGITDDEIENVVLSMNLGGDAMPMNVSGMLHPDEEMTEDNVVVLEVKDNDEAC